MVRCTDRPIMTIAVDWDVNQQNKKKNIFRTKNIGSIRVDHMESSILIDTMQWVST